MPGNRNSGPIAIPLSDGLGRFDLRARVRGAGHTPLARRGRPATPAPPGGEISGAKHNGSSHYPWLHAPRAVAPSFLPHCHSYGSVGEQIQTGLWLIPVRWMPGPWSGTASPGQSASVGAKRGRTAFRQERRPGLPLCIGSRDLPLEGAGRPACPPGRTAVLGHGTLASSIVAPPTPHRNIGALPRRYANDATTTPPALQPCSLADTFWRRVEFHIRPLVERDHRNRQFVCSSAHHRRPLSRHGARRNRRNA